jgi:hypothetical protein
VLPGQEPSTEALKALTYAQYAHRHHWTPKQVDDQVYAWLDGLLLDVEDLIEEVSYERSRRQAAADSRPG